MAYLSRPLSAVAAGDDWVVRMRFRRKNGNESYPITGWTFSGKVAYPGGSVDVPAPTVDAGISTVIFVVPRALTATIPPGKRVRFEAAIVNDDGHLRTAMLPFSSVLRKA